MSRSLADLRLARCARWDRAEGPLLRRRTRFTPTGSRRRWACGTARRRTRPSPRTSSPIWSPAAWTLSRACSSCSTSPRRCAPPSRRVRPGPGATVRSPQGAQRAQAPARARPPRRQGRILARFSFLTAVVLAVAVAVAVGTFGSTGGVSRRLNSGLERVSLALIVPPIGRLTHGLLPPHTVQPSAAPAPPSPQWQVLQLMPTSARAVRSAAPRRDASGSTTYTAPAPRGGRRRRTGEACRRRGRSCEHQQPVPLQVQREL